MILIILFLVLLGLHYGHRNYAIYVQKDLPVLRPKKHGKWVQSPKGNELESVELGPVPEHKARQLNQYIYLKIIVLILIAIVSLHYLYTKK